MTKDQPDSDGAQADAAASAHKAFRADEHGGEPGEAPPVTKEERDAPSPTDTTGATPMGVGESKTEGAEEIAMGTKEAGRQDTGTQGKTTERPTGSSTGRDVTGVNPSESGTMESDAT